MIKLKRTNSKDADFVKLVGQLDAYLKVVDGEEHDFYHQYNGIAHLNNTVVAHWNGKPAGCGAFKMFDEKSTEVKRMFTYPDYRGKKIATSILTELEKWTKELGYEKCILETGKRQVEAVAFYKNRNYEVIPNFGPYKNIENSICFEKILN